MSKAIFVVVFAVVVGGCASRGVDVDIDNAEVDYPLPCDEYAKVTPPPKEHRSSVFVHSYQLAKRGAKEAADECKKKLQE